MSKLTKTDAMRKFNLDWHDIAGLRHEEKVGARVGPVPQQGGRWPRPATSLADQLLLDSYTALLWVLAWSFG